MAHTETTGEMAKESEQPSVRLTPRGHVMIEGRRITPDDLVGIGHVLSGEPFNEHECVIEDEQGRHEGGDVPSLIDRLLWRSVAVFDFSAQQSVRSGGHLVFGYVRVQSTGIGAYVGWSAAPNTDREAIERAFKRVVELIEGLPPANGWNIYTTKGEEEKRIAAEQAAAERRRFWQLWRKPESFTDWLISGPVYSIALAVTIAIILLSVPK